LVSRQLATFSTCILAAIKQQGQQVLEINLQQGYFETSLLAVPSLSYPYLFRKEPLEGKHFLLCIFALELDYGR
jgi:hypothetical protein